ncbi:hypothetical protein QRD43_05785 [Pelomonas sp. APW6]|uniref:Uncharacterized protein n=1 Tax=Roseateles subflavus TaxID=3053353 RepID=A0ABT7LEY9_9BURK|nr:hypothetical protein [Pelomonas sp. APW6]MDL5031415.1 hypothetical protein [Pelomonas sp. APW6]
MTEFLSYRQAFLKIYFRNFQTAWRNIQISPRIKTEISLRPATSVLRFVSKHCISSEALDCSTAFSANARLSEEILEEGPRGPLTFSQ